MMNSRSTPIAAVDAAASAPLISAVGVGVRYGARDVLTDVCIDVRPHSITALVGPSGCGKTSFLNCFNRLTDLTRSCRVSGSIKIGTTEVLNRDTDLLALRSRVGMVFQKPSPFPLSIWKNVALPLKQHGVRARRDLDEHVEAALRDVGLWDEVKDRLSTPALALSGGQQQRLCIARALALRPDVILFDEPCSALDPMASQVVESLIMELRRRVTVLIVTHNLAQARRVADDVGVFWTVGGVGRLIEHGSKARVFDSPQHPATAAYLNGTSG